ncbi:MAG: GAF domain-containing protein [Thermoflexales bacterium]|nr:GAF domain-containing protein [Thermoflexales bacterium]
MGDESPHNLSGSNRLTPLIIALIYVALGVAWISLSDRLLESVAANPLLLLQLHTLKGWVYVLTTGLLLYWLIARSTARLRHTVATLTHEMMERQQIEAARLQAEAAERQQRLLAEALRDTAEALTTTLDFDEVLDRILANIDRVVPYDAALILLMQDGVATFARSRGYAERGLTEWLSQLQLRVADTANLRLMVDTGQPLFIPHTHDYPGWLDFPESRWVESYLGAPIRNQGRVVGFLNLVSATSQFYAPDHARSLQAFADQASMAIENARLFQATQRHLAEQIALVEASRAMSASLDLPVVLQRLAEQMCRALNATSTYIAYWDPADNSTTTVAEYYSAAASERERLPDPVDIDYEDDIAFLKKGEPLVRQVDDPTTPVSTRDHLRYFGAYSLLATPLIAKGLTYGYISIWESRRRRDFTPDEINLAQAIAQQAAIAFDNARLFDAERRQLVLARTLQAVGALLTAEMSLDAVLERVFDLLAEVVHYDSVALELLDEFDQFYLAAQRGYPDPDLARYTTRHETGPAVRQRWAHDAVFVIDDTLTDPRWISVPDFSFIRSRVGVWLRVRSHTLGILNVDSRAPNAYDATAVETIRAFAHQAAVAIENAQLAAAIREQAAQLSVRVTERTAELERERRRLQAILDAAGEGVLFTDTHGVIEYVNPAMERLTGYTRSEVLGQTARLWSSGRTPQAVYDQMWRTIMHGEIWIGELVNRHKDGRLYDCALAIAPLRDAADQIVGYVGIQRDVTHHKELDRLKDQFVSNVSHELRTPLANVKLYLGLLERGRVEKREQYLQTLLRETARLENLIENLLDISRLDLGATSIRMSATSLDTVLLPLIADRAQLAAQRGLTLASQLRPDLPTVLIDPDLLTQVMSNLLGNAINYTPAGGRITISTDSVCVADTAGRWVTVSIQDTGPGITVADRPHIFERFYRGAAGRRSGAPGTGLGLAICKEIVERLQGRLTLDSEPGQGATFTVWLPVVEVLPEG